MCKSNIPFHELWMYFWRNHTDFTAPGSEAVVAKNEKTGVTLCMGKSDNCPELRVYLADDGDPHVVRSVFNMADCTATAARLYTHWLSDPVDDSRSNGGESEVSEEQQETTPTAEQDKEEPQESDLTPDEMIYEREDDLRNAMGDLLAVILCEDDGIAVREAYGQKMVDECTDLLVEYLADVQGISVYRPTFIDNDAGEKEFVEFPYGEDA